MKYRDATPDDLNPKQAMRNPYEKDPTERFRPSEHTTVMNPYEKTAPPQSQPFSETKPQSFSVSSSKRTTTNPYKTPYKKTTPPQSQPFSGTKPRSFSARLSKRTMTNQTSVSTRQPPSVSTSAKQSISAKQLKAASTRHKFQPFRPLISTRVIDLNEATETTSLALASNQKLR